MRQGDFAALGDVARDGARACGDKAAIIFGDGEIMTYSRLEDRSNRVAQVLCEEGVRKGDRVAMLGKNSLAYVEVMFGVAKLGAAFTPINWRLAPPEVGFIVKDSGASVVLVDAELASLLDGQVPSDVAVIVVGDADREDGYERRMARASDAAPGVAVARSDLAMLVYTSGTTGHPKGAMLSHATFARHCDLDAAGLPEGEDIGPDDTALLVLPLFHIGSIEPLLRLLFSRGTVVLHREFDPARYIVDMQGRRATILALVPTALQIVLHHPDAGTADFSSVRRFYYGASPIPLGLLQEALSRVDCEFVQAYGMTESCGTCVMLAPADHADAAAPRLRSAGRPVSGTELKVLDAEGRPAVPHTVGEIALRGSCIMTGYWNRPEATAEALGSDGWLKTGDAGYLDEDGYVYIHDRVKDMICSGGENIYPAEVESAVYGHPDVAEVAVVGVPDPQWGEAVKAIVVARPGHAIDAGEVIAWTRGRIAHYKAPRSVDVIAELPKNAAGKILRRTLRDGYWAGRERLVN